jgi:hypothetical protein
MKTAALSLVLSGILLSTAAQIPRSFGEITFLLPSSYSMATYPDGAVLTYIDENKSAYFMFIFPAANSTGNPQTDFNDAWNKMYSVFSHTESGNFPVPEKKKHPKGWDYYEGATNCIHNNGKPFYGWLSILMINGKVVAFGSGAPSASQFQYNLVFTNTVLNSLDLSSHSSSTQPSRTSEFNNGISGVWQSVKSSLLLDGSVGRNIKRIAFFDDGVFCYEIPTAGLDSMDRAGHEAWRKGYWGTYTFDDRTGKVNFSTYKNEPLKLAGSNVSFLNMEFEKIRSVDRLTFEGTYTSKTNPKDWWRGYEPLVKFNRDGTFEDNGALFDVDADVCPTCPTYKPGRGNYQCRNYSLVLFYTDGRKGQIALYTIDWKNPSSPDFISLGKDLLKRKK